MGEFTVVYNWRYKCITHSRTVQENFKVKQGTHDDTVWKSDIGLTCHLIETLIISSFFCISSPGWNILVEKSQVFIHVPFGQSCFPSCNVLTFPAMTSCGRRAAHCQLPPSAHGRWGALSFFYTSKDKLNLTAGLRSCCSRCSIHVRRPARSLQVIMLSETLYFQWCTSRSFCCPHVAFGLGFQCELYIRFPSVCQLLSLSLCQFFILKSSLG